MAYGFTTGGSTTNCITCQKNLSYPSHQRPMCPHHRDPYAPPPGSYYPTAPPTGGYYPPSAGGYNPPPPSYPGTGYPQPPTYPSGPAQNISCTSWIEANIHSALPHGAVKGGTDIDGHPIYVGRAHHERDLLPAKVIPGKRSCYVSYNGKEHLKHAYQILIDCNARWVPSSGGQVPYDAIEGGRTANGEKLYIGRTWHNGSQTVGKIHPSHRTCYIPFDGKEVGYPNYEVLVSRR